MLCHAVMYRLPHLQTVGISLDGDSTAGDLDPVLCQLHMHATCLRGLGLKLSTDYTDDAAWVSVGKMVILTNLQLHFDRKVRSCGGSWWHLTTVVLFLHLSAGRAVHLRLCLLLILLLLHGSIRAATVRREPTRPMGHQSHRKHQVDIVVLN